MLVIRPAIKGSIVAVLYSIAWRVSRPAHCFRKGVAFKPPRADLRTPNCIRNMTQENHQDRLRLGRNAWLAIIILAIALCATTTQSASAKRHSMEIPDAAIHRDLVYKHINGRELKLDLYCPQNASAHRLLSFGSMLRAGDAAEKSNTFR